MVRRPGRLLKFFLLILLLMPLLLRSDNAYACLGCTFPSGTPPTAGAAACPLITQFGGAGDGVADNTTPFNATVASNPTEPCVALPPGNFKFSAAPTVSLATTAKGFSLIGSGPGVSTMFWPNAGGGITIEKSTGNQPVSLSNLSFVTGIAGGGTALTITETASAGDFTGASLDHIVMTGSDGYNLQANYWTKHVLLQGVGNGVNITNSNFYGGGAHLADGIDFEQGPTGQPAYILNIIGSNIFGMNQAVIYGTNTQGIVIEGGSNIVGGNYGVVVPAGGSNRDQLTIIGSSINTCIAGVNELGSVPFTSISGTTFIPGGGSSACPNAIGINLAANAPFQIQGNNFQAGSPGATGVKFSSGSGRIEGNVFQTLNNGVWAVSPGTEFFITMARNTFEADVTTPYLNQFGWEIDGFKLWGSPPTLVGSTTAGTPTYTVAAGTYTRQGAWVTANFHVGISAWTGSPAGNLMIGNLPYANSAGDVGACSISTASGITFISGYTQIMGRVEPSAVQIGLFEGVNAGAMTNVTVAQVNPASTEILGTCQYHLQTVPNGDGGGGGGGGGAASLEGRNGGGTVGRNGGGSVKRN